MPRFTRLLAAALSGIVILGLCVATAEARGVPRVSGVVKAGQLAHRGLVKITWHGVRGARYQMRLAAAPRRLPAARVIRSGDAQQYTPRLVDRRLYYVQVRAIRGGAKGPWSRATRVRLVAPVRSSGVVVNHPL